MQCLHRTVNDTGKAQEPILPCLPPNGSDDRIPRISKETLLAQRIVDCRFDYEYDGGHIDGAVKANNQLFILIFYCEYSVLRAPQMAQYVRSRDRTRNMEVYPNLTFPDVYVLDGGYSAFFPKNQDRCSPPYYIPMKNKQHSRARRQGLERLRARRGHIRSCNELCGVQDARERENLTTTQNRCDW
ncbi:putative M-phase inducer phosphatase [Dactylonectria estremocensis]|uniref:M-phase inducer phosphatase n=1 Tax=Dactylonectria estremocensis TaxID=1079267 RepID=A0A9P9I7F4_9HYPO|nr:putative M-phase inducer phosphatase [Dactylonectria estremocensis]